MSTPNFLLLIGLIIFAAFLITWGITGIAIQYLNGIACGCFIGSLISRRDE